MDVVLTVLGITFAETNFSIAKRKSFEICFPSVDLRTMKLGKEVVAFSILRLPSVSAWNLLDNFMELYRGKEDIHSEIELIIY